MPLTGTEAALAALIESKVEASYSSRGATFTDEAKAAWEGVATAIAEAVIEHLTGTPGVAAVGAHAPGGVANLV